MRKVAIIGGGVSGLSAANLLKDRFVVSVFEKEPAVGGLIRCERIAGSLFHTCGGHVFNTKNPIVSKWFWERFDPGRDFIKAKRRSAVCLDGGRFVDYPIENHVYQLDEEVQQSFRRDLLDMMSRPDEDYANFGEFLLKRFGKTLFDLYFRPYNAKIWRRKLTDVPLAWLDGKLPMPTPREMLLANENHIEENSFVHSEFFYPRYNGSQFIVDALSKGLNIRCNNPVERVAPGKVNGETFDAIVYCGNLKELPTILQGIDLGGLADELSKLEGHGTTAVFCEMDTAPYSWFYQPSPMHDSHRCICTGNFSPTNNAPGKMTGVFEFTDEISKDEILRQLRLMPYHPQYLTHKYTRYSYPVQHSATRDVVSAVKNKLAECGIYLCGRFAEWEYYNMDAAIGSAMSLPL